MPNEPDPIPIIKLENAKRQYDQAGIEYPESIEDIDPTVALRPKLYSLDPASAEVGGDDFVLSLVGNYFTPDSVIVFNGGDEPTTKENDGLLTTIVRPSTASGPITVPILVRTGEFETDPLNFSFVEAVVPPEPEVPPEVPPPEEGGEEPPEEPEVLSEEDGEEQRAFPLGPFTISKIEDHPDGISLIVDGDIQAEDTVVIEATGNSTMNGTFLVSSVEDGMVIVDNTNVLEIPIENRGRLTVVS